MNNLRFPELVEGLFFLATASDEGQGFDKLSHAVFLSGLKVQTND